MNQRLQRIREFIQYDLWRQSDVAIHDPKKRLLYRTLQTIILVARGFKDKALNVRANSLSFSLLFAFVPLIAGVFAIARGFGFEELLREQLSTSFLAEANIVPIIIEWVDRYLETARDGIFLGIETLTYGTAAARTYRPSAKDVRLGSTRSFQHRNRH